MALPTAPLGQLPSMNMPYAIPTYEKGPSIWEKALASFLVNAAGGAAQSGVQNLLTRDSAAEFGEKPATGLSRLLGPKVGPDEAKQRRQNVFSSNEAKAARSASEAEANKQRAFDADQLRLRLDTAAAQAEADALNQRTREGDRTQASLDEQYLQDRNAQLRAGQQDDAAIELENLRALLRSKDPENVADTEYKRALARKAEAEAGAQEYFTDRFKGSANNIPGNTPAVPGVDPAVAAFGKTQATGVARPPDFVSTRDDIARFLAEGRSPQEIESIVARQQATDTAAQAKPLPDIRSNQPVDPRLEEILRHLKMLPTNMNEMPVSDYRMLR